MEKILNERSTKKDLWGAYQKLLEMSDEGQSGMEQGNGDGKEIDATISVEKRADWSGVQSWFSTICGELRLT